MEEFKHNALEEIQNEKMKSIYTATSKKSFILKTISLNLF